MLSRWVVPLNLTVCPTPLSAQITGLDDKDIVFVRFEGEGGPHCLPYFIGLDHEKESVVVSIRGTLSVEVCTGGLSRKLRACGHKQMVGISINCNQRHATCLDMTVPD